MLLRLSSHSNNSVTYVCTKKIIHEQLDLTLLDCHFHVSETGAGEEVLLEG